jgi:hypothetical protein
MGVSAYFLRSHVYMCPVRDGVIFLDLKQDKYFGVGISESCQLSTLVPGWPAPENMPADSPRASANSDGISLAESLVKKGVFTCDAAEGKAAELPPVPTPLSALIQGDLGSRPPIRVGHICAFLVAAWTSAGLLRWRPLEDIVDRVRRRKSRDRRVRSFDREIVPRLVAVFQRLRPFVFTSRNRCLFDSLALIEFLHRYGYHPTWVFGVNSGPFAAHCWLQEGDVSLNSDLESVREYVPIFAV